MGGGVGIAGLAGWGGGGKGAVLGVRLLEKNWCGGVCCPLPKTLALFTTRNLQFSLPYYTYDCCGCHSFLKHNFLLMVLLMMMKK